MAIESYTGGTGSGKSYNVVERVLIPALKEGRAVAHNLKLDLEMLRHVCELDKLPPMVQLSDEMTAQEIIEAAKEASLIILDESWQWWPTGTTADNMPREEREFFAKHRHRAGSDGHSRDIILICPNISQLAKFVRDLIRRVYDHEKLDHVGAESKFRVDIYRKVAGQDKLTKAYLLRSSYGTYKAAIQECYVSQTLATEHGSEAAVDKRANIWRGILPYQMAGGLMMIIASIYWLWTIIAGYMGDKPKPVPQRPLLTSSALAKVLPQAPVQPLATAPAAPAPQPVQPRIEAVQASPQAPASPASGAWRLLGVVLKKDGSGLAIVASATATRRLPASDCRPLKTRGDFECLVDGQLVSMWSGDRPGIGSAQLAPLTLKPQK